MTNEGNLYSKTELNQLFLKVIEHDFHEFGDSLTYSECVKKCNSILTVEEFVQEIQGFYENANIHSSRLAKVKIILRKLLTCPDCVINRINHQDDHVLRPCRKPHALIWYKRRLNVEGRVIPLVLPAKVIYIDTTSNKTLIQIIDHKSAAMEVSVSTTTIRRLYGYGLTENYPFDKSSIRRADRTLLRHSLNLLNEHIKVLKSRFGTQFKIYHEIKQLFKSSSHLLPQSSPFIQTRSSTIAG